MLKGQKPGEGRGSVTPYGYRRVTCRDRKQRFEHVIIWEKHYGPIPKGKEIHHINGNKLDNRIDNLALVTRLTHKRIHSGCFRLHGVWHKRCRRCRWYRPIDTEFYVYPGGKGASIYCRRCAIDLAIEYKKRRRKQRLAEKHCATMTETTPAVAGAGSGRKGK